MQKRNVNELWEIHDVAAWLRTTPARVYELVRADNIPIKKVGRLWRLRIGDLLAWVAAGGNLRETGI